MKEFFSKYQVLISSIAAALGLVLQQFIGQAEIDYKALGLAALIAVAGIIGNEFRGKGVSILGFIGIAATAFITVQTTSNFTWSQFGLSVVIGLLAMVAAPAKDIQYEKSATIEGAKAEGESIKAQEKIDANKA